MNTTKTAQFTPVCTCQAVREYYDTGIGEMFEDKVRLCPFHTAAPAMYGALQVAHTALSILPIEAKQHLAGNAVSIIENAIAQAEGRHHE